VCGFRHLPAAAKYVPVSGEHRICASDSSSMEHSMSVERHVSPDGAFTLVVDPGEDTIGFEGHFWRIHIDDLPSYRIDPPIATVTQLLAALDTRRLVMVISRFDDTGDAIRDVWITHDPAAEKRGSDEGESLEFRYWDGAASAPA
jgi:hypothetical protein